MNGHLAIEISEAHIARSLCNPTKNKNKKIKKGTQ